jgi:hypothetical protein
MSEQETVVLAKLREALKLPADTSHRQVLAAFETDAVRRASAVGLPSNAPFAQIEAAEAAVATAAAKARRVAAAGAVGHPVAAVQEEEFHPALRPVINSHVGRQTGATSKSIDYAALMAEDE